MDKTPSSCGVCVRAMSSSLLHSEERHPDVIYIQAVVEKAFCPISSTPRSPPHIQERKGDERSFSIFLILTVPLSEHTLPPP
ncbi:hypothetical protein NQZ68_010289 [Dissostichus eleginoides]|nr:hypothetical protein NQZ68_010289 [Dissostichus eleginoides]